MNLFGTNVKVVFLVKDKRILAYAWHYSKEKALKHLYKICEYHDLRGNILESKKLENWLKDELEKVVIKGKRFSLPEFEYKNKKLYEKLIEIPKGKTATYSEIAKLSRIKYAEMLIALMRNPFLVLTPCHRLVTKKNTLMGFYPLGLEVKRRVLEIEGVKI